MLKGRVDGEHAVAAFGKREQIDGALQHQLGLAEDTCPNRLPHILAHRCVHGLGQVAVQSPRIQALDIDLQIQIAQRFLGLALAPSQIEVALGQIVFQLAFVDMQDPALVPVLPGQFGLGLLQWNPRFCQPIDQAQAAVVDGHLRLAAMFVELKLQLRVLCPRPPQRLRWAVGSRRLQAETIELTFDVELNSRGVHIKPSQVQLGQLTLWFGLVEQLPPINRQGQTLTQSAQHGQVDTVNLQLSLLRQARAFVVPSQAAVATGPGLAIIQSELDILGAQFMTQAFCPHIEMQATADRLQFKGHDLRRPLQLDLLQTQIQGRLSPHATVPIGPSTQPALALGQGNATPGLAVNRQLGQINLRHFSVETALPCADVTGVAVEQRLLELALQTHPLAPVWRRRCIQTPFVAAQAVVHQQADIAEGHRWLLIEIVNPAQPTLVDLKLGLAQQPIGECRGV